MKWVTRYNPFSTVLTSRHLASSSAWHVPLWEIRSLDDAAFLFSSRKKKFSKNLKKCSCSWPAWLFWLLAKHRALWLGLQNVTCSRVDFQICTMIWHIFTTPFYWGKYLFNISGCIRLLWKSCESMSWELLHQWDALICQVFNSARSAKKRFSIDLPEQNILYHNI